MTTVSGKMSVCECKDDLGVGVIFGPGFSLGHGRQGSAETVRDLGFAVIFGMESILK